MPVYAKRCRYCRREIIPPHEPTIDHVVPKWVMRALPVARPLFRDPANTVTVCNHCNRMKGSMPVAIFLAIRHDGRRVKAERSRWDQIAAWMREGNKRELGSLKALILTEFSKPIPEHFSPLPVTVRPVPETAVDWITGLNAER